MKQLLIVPVILLFSVACYSQDISELKKENEELKAQVEDLKAKLNNLSELVEKKREQEVMLLKNYEQEVKRWKEKAQELEKYAQKSAEMRVKQQVILEEINKDLQAKLEECKKRNEELEKGN